MINRKAVAVFVFALASLVVLPNARASEFNQATKLTFSQSVQIPGQILPAGTYWFVAPIQYLVQIFSSDRATLYATLLTVSAEHLAPSDETQITFADRSTMQPEAIVTWFYPGDTIGREFLYPKQDQKEIAQAKQRTVLAGKEIAQTKQFTVPGGKESTQARQRIPAGD
jgi:hypothetical protein